MGEKKKASAAEPGKSVRLDPGLAKRVRVYAAQNNMRNIDVLNAAVAEYLKRKGA